jgi:hypothetical protein
LRFGRRRKRQLGALVRKLRAAYGLGHGVALIKRRVGTAD